jgi:hypothetical protein
LNYGVTIFLLNWSEGEADRHAEEVRPIIDAIRARGEKSLRAIAAELTRMHVRTARAGSNGPLVKVGDDYLRRAAEWLADQRKDS